MRILAMFAGGFSAAAFLSCYLVPEWFLLPMVVLSLLLAAFGKKVRSRQNDPGLIVMLICAGLAAGFLWSAVYRMIFLAPARALDGRTVRLSGVAAEYPRQETSGVSVLVRVEMEQGATVTAEVRLDEQAETIRPGDHIETVAFCELATRNRGGEPIFYDTAKGIFLRAQAYGRLEITRPNWTPLRYWPVVISKALNTSIDQSVPEDVSPLMKALVTGDRQDMGTEMTGCLRRAGLSHVVAVSGMHLAVLADLLALLLGRGKRSTALAVIGFSAVFCGVAGNTPSVVRAAIMITMLQLAPLLNRERDDVTALLFALMLLLIWNPMSAAHVGLQLSFAAVAGILLTSRPIQTWLCAGMRLDKLKKYRRLRPVQTCLYHAAEVLATTLGASLFTLLLSTIHFNTISLISPISNLTLVWMVSLILPGSFLAGLAGIFSPAAGTVVAAPFVLLARIFLAGTEWFAKPALASIPLDVVYYQIWLLFVCILLVVNILLPGRKQVRYPACTAAVLLAVAVTLTVQDFRRGELLVTVLDVGQGQSVVLRAGENVALVDCGGFGRANAGDVAADYLLSRGVKSIDLLVLSHYDADHANGVPQLLRRVKVDTVVLPPIAQDDPIYDETMSMLQAVGAKVQQIKKDDVVVSDGKDKTITVYPPMVGRQEGNLRSLTVLAAAGETEVLITGDMNQTVEERLLARRKLPDVELMVAGHHGSDDANGARLLNRVRPERVVISAGKHNRYGHPGREALERFAEIGAEVYCTDWDGTVTVCFDSID